jgi:ATP-dependent DNA helicase PIF1
LMDDELDKLLQAEATAAAAGNTDSHPTDNEDDDISTAPSGTRATVLESVVITLNEEQRRIVKWAKKHPRSNIFITGAAGTGKSELLKHLKEELENDGRWVWVTASTAFAARRVNGRTVHSTFHLGFGRDNIDRVASRYDNLPDEERDVFTDVQDIMLDEISMISADIFDLIYYQCIHIYKSRRKMPRFIIFGDWFQMPPVFSEEEWQMREKKKLPIFAFQSAGWKKLHFKTFELTKIERQRDPHFARMLSMVREGHVTDEIERFFLKRVEVTRQMKHYQPTAYERGITRVLGRRVNVSKANENHLANLPGALHRIDPAVVDYEVLEQKGRGARKGRTTFKLKEIEDRASLGQGDA